MPLKIRSRSFAVPALFLHIQKTAGTSLVNLVSRYYGSSVTSHGECWGKKPEQCRDIRFVSGHIGYDFARELMQGRYTFTFLRDPAERILSMYSFCRTRDPAEYQIYRLAWDMSLPDFLEAGISDRLVKKNIWNNQVWQLAHGYAHRDNRTIDDFSEDELLNLAKQHLAEFSYVGFTETFAIDVSHIIHSLGLPKSQAVPISNATNGRLRVSQQSVAVQGLLDQLTVLDKQLYNFARDMRCESRKGWWTWW